LPSQDELELADSLGVVLDPQPVAFDAFVFILNVANPVDTLTLQNVKDIYTGSLTNWSSAGGRDEEIHPYQRDPNSGSQELMLTMVMSDLEMIDAPDMVLLGMMGPINRLPTDSLGIAYTVYFFKKFMAPNDKIKMCAIDGIMPDYETIQAKQYPLWNQVYVGIRADQDPKSAPYHMREWLVAREGQEVVKESGYVPVRLAQ
jgi:phosphate transport system substrate-binding protein